MAPASLLPPGPASMQEAMAWPGAYLKLLPATGVRLVREVLARGISISTHYSGCGMAEIAFSKLAAEVAQDPAGVAEAPPLIDVFHACEINGHRRAVLRSHVGSSRPRHVFADLLSRYPQVTVSRATEAHESANAILMASLKKAQGAAERSKCIAEAGAALEKKLMAIFSESVPSILPTSYCCVHKRECPIFDIDCAAIRRRGGLIGNIAGTTCTAHSSLGSGLRGVGKSAVAAMGWAWERRLRQEAAQDENEDFFLHECTFAFPSKEYFENLFPGKPIFVWVLEPGMFGHPCQRRRRFTLVVNTRLLHAVSIPSDIGSDWRAFFDAGPLAFSASVASAASEMFFCAPDKLLWRFLHEYAKQRRSPITSSSLADVFHSLLPSGYKERLAEHQAVVKALGNSDQISFLNMNPSFIPPCRTLPCLTARMNFMWSHRHGRFLIPCEALWAMGVETDLQRGGSIDFGASGITAFTDLYELAGNGMHVPTMGAIITWFLTLCGRAPSG